MAGRSGVLVTVLGAFVLIAMVAGYFLLLQPASHTAGPELAHQDAWNPEHPFDIENSSAAEKVRAAERERALEQARLRAEREAAAMLMGDEAERAAADDGEIPEIDPSEINKAIPGFLLIRVMNHEEGRPLAGVTVYFPVRGTRLESEAGSVRISESVGATLKRTNRHGVAAWHYRELRELLKQQAETEDKQTSVLITSLSYADVFEPLAIPNLSEGAERTFRLVPAARVTGKVREKRGGVVAYADVEILQTNQSADTGSPINRFRTRADSMGEFTIKLANNYLYVFEVRQPGYSPYTSRAFNFREERREVSILLEAGRGISGIVLNGANQPIAGAEVWARDDGIRTLTSDDGKFAIDMVRDRIFRNDVNLRFSAEGYAPQEEKVLANDHEVEVRLEPEGSLSGFVVNDRGEKVAGAQVRCTYIEGDNRFPYDAALSGPEGEFRFGGFAEGRVQISAHLNELYSLTRSISVKAGEHAGPITLTLITGATVTGRVTSGGLAVEGVTVALNDKPAAATDGGGTYTITGIADGKHKLKIVNQHPIANEQLRQLPVFTGDGERFYYLPKEREVTLKLADTETVDFEVQAFDTGVMRQVNVRVTTQPNEPAQAVQVTIRPTFGKPPEGVEAPKTQVLALNLPEGRAEMPLTLISGVSYEVTFEHNRFFEAKLANEALEGIADGGSIEVVLERAFILKGVVRDSNGNGVEGVRMSRDASNPWNTTATTDIYGAFEFGQLNAGEYAVSAFKTGYYQERVNVSIGGIDPEPLEITLVGANEIRIVVVNNGTPQAGAHIHIYRNDAEGDDPDDFKRHFDIGTTDAKGEKYINFHWVRNYQICAFHGNLVAFTNFNNLKEVPEREVTITLEPAFDLTGEVVDAETGQPLGGSFVRAHLATTGTEGRDGNFFQMQVGGNGRFSFKVPSGNYYFYVPRTRSHESFNTEGSTVPAGSTGVVLSIPLRDDIQGNYAQVLSFSAPQSMTAGEEYQVSVNVRNMGNTTWASTGNRPYRLGSEAPRDNNRWGTTRVNIQANVEVRPKETYTFSFTVTAPQQAGNHNMQWRMVQDGREWFGQTSERLQINVAAN